MLFVIDCVDKPEHLAIRLAHREAHLTYVRGFLDTTIRRWAKVLPKEHPGNEPPPL